MNKSTIREYGRHFQGILRYTNNQTSNFEGKKEERNNQNGFVFVTYSRMHVRYAIVCLNADDCERTKAVTMK